MKNTLIFLMMLFTFLSCNQTYYQPISKHNHEGFKEIKIEENIYQVLFFGNIYTTSLQAMNYCFYRCAEFTKEKGFKFFMVLETENLTNYGGDYHNSPCFVKVIKFVSEKPDNCQAHFYNAEEVIKNLNSTIIKNLDSTSIIKNDDGTHNPH